jgi:DNA-binding transcriptional ArsR family regulator
MYYSSNHANTQVGNKLVSHTTIQDAGIMSVSRSATCPTMQDLPPEALDQVAGYFQALSEPTRLRILNLLRDGERNVGDIAQATGFTAANVSRHLSLLAERGMVARESRGTSVWYRIADPAIYDLCDLVCGSIARSYEQAAAERAAFVRTAGRSERG